MTNSEKFARNVLLIIKTRLPEVLGIPAEMLFPKSSAELDNPELDGIQLVEKDLELQSDMKM